MKPADLTAETPIVTLITLARQGSTRAFELLVERHRLRLFCTAMRYTRNYDDACDITQDALSRAWERLHTLREPAYFPRWIEQIVVHLSLDARRRSVRHPEQPLPSMPDESSDSRLASMLPHQEETTRRALLDQEISAQLLRAIEALPGTLRQAAYLRFVEGLKGEEVASRLGIDYEAAKKRIYRATLELRRRLQPLYDELTGCDSP